MTVTVSKEAAEILNALADNLFESLEQIRDGKCDPLGTIEDIASQLILLASGSWGEGTTP